MSELSTWLEFAQLQVVCESYLEKIDWRKESEAKPQLLLGNNRRPDSIDDIGGATRFTESQATWFFANYDIVDHYANDASGFSCTLMRRKNSSNAEENGVYTLSMRSTEFQFNSKGGDWSRDGKPGADGQINDNGYAIAQLSAMEAYFKDLYSGKRPAAIPTQPINVTGYSLSGNLASALALMHPAEVKVAYTYNAAGLGNIDGKPPTGAQISAMIGQFNQKLPKAISDICRAPIAVGVLCRME